MKQYRIQRQNEHNWVIEELHAAGELIQGGPESGKVRQSDRWTVVGYYSRLEYATKALLDRVTGDEVQRGQDILKAIEAAQEAVIEVARNASARVVEQSSSNPANQWETLSEEQKEEIRLANKPSAVYLRITGGKRFKRTSDETRRGLSPDQAALERVG